MEALALTLQESKHEVRWFARDAAVVVDRTSRAANVIIGGTLIGSYDEDDDDRGPRNILVVTLAKSDQFHLGRLAEAFGMTDEHLRRLRRKEEASGLVSVIGTRRGKNFKVGPEQRAAWFAMFDEGRMPIDAHREQPRRDRRAYSTVWRVYEQWKQERVAQPTNPSQPAPAAASAGQLALPSLAVAAETVATPETPDERAADIVPMTAQPVRGGKMVQHVGSWMLLALAGEMGLYEEAQCHHRPRRAPLPPASPGTGIAGDRDRRCLRRPRSGPAWTGLVGRWCG